MLRDVQVPFFPSSTHCLAWSEDGELAITAGEYVHILVPNRRAGSQTSNAKSKGSWVHVRIRTNLFTFKEWPLQEPASFKDFSIGEEQSISLVTALAWSPQGLAKHHRSVLAVLTSNLVLSLWESRPNPAEETSWRRALIVNDAIANYLKSQRIPELTLRKRKRVRAVAWAQSYVVSGKAAGPYLLAVSNDYHEITFLRVTSPYGKQTMDKPHWTVSVVGHYSEGLPGERLRFGSTRDLAWGTWSIERGNLITSLSYRNDGYTTTLECSLDVNNALHHELAFHVSILSKVKQDTPFFHPATSRHLQGSPDDGRMLETHDQAEYTDAPWDLITDLASVGSPKDDSRYLFVARHILPLEILKQTESTGRSKPTQCRGISTLKKRISECRDRFAAEHGLGKSTLIKTWGVATWNGYIAACFTLHPSEMVEYIIASAEYSTLVFSHVDLEDMATHQTSRASQKQHFQWETLLRLTSPPTAHGSALDLLLNSPLSSKHTKINDPLSARILYAAACATALLWDPNRSDRLTNAQTALQELQRLKNIDLNPELTYLASLQASPTLDPDTVINTLNTAMHSRSNQQHLASPPTPLLLETCHIPGCAEAIVWVNLTSARCARGHPWHRCTLTFLTIQEPGISKYCERCGREYLNEDMLFEKENVNDASTGTDTITSENSNDESLARKLYDTFTTCIFCGGKFVG